MVVDGISYFNGAEKFAEKIKGRGSFVLLMGNTDTAFIPGITAAGISPEMTPYTPPLDAELVETGRILTLGDIPLTPEAIPTPGLITRAVVTLSDFRRYYVDTGMTISPIIPHYRVGGIPGKDIRTGKALTNVREIIENAKKVGAQIASESEYLVIGESIAAGTTTALGVLLAMGYGMDGYTSSSLKVNPQSLKSSVALEGLKKAGISQPVDPIKAIESVGDPMMAGAIGLILGAKNVPIILAGGTQMATVAVLLSRLVDLKNFNIALATTGWVARDSTASLFGILKQGKADIPVMTADLSFARSSLDGLLAYERGHVKEGVGAGGISVAAMLKGVKKEQIEDTVDFMFSKMVGQ